MALVALLSNPSSTGNRESLPRLRSFCASRADVFHYEVEEASQIGDALASIARVRPRVLVINGGDGTVQATLTELHNGRQFGGDVPPVAVLPNGKTNLIALDLGAEGDPLEALERILEIAESDMSGYIVNRELIALTDGDQDKLPVLGMFLGGAGFADIILYCRHKIYPLGLPNGVSHFLAGIAVIISMLFGIRGSYFLPRPNPVRVSLISDEKGTKRFSFLIVTTLEKLLMTGRNKQASGLRLMAVEQSIAALLRGLWAGIFGKLGNAPVTGVHVEHGDLIRIESDATNVILDGETFSATRGRPIVLRSTAPVPFLRIAI